jgi:hypothetical protein
VSARHETERLEVDELVAALERAWGAIRAHHREVPPVVLVLGTSSARRAARQKLGHFAPARWLPFYVVEAAEPTNAIARARTRVAVPFAPAA